jgi:hypothetical protein
MQRLFARQTGAELFRHPSTHNHPQSPARTHARTHAHTPTESQALTHSLKRAKTHIQPARRVPAVGRFVQLLRLAPFRKDLSAGSLPCSLSTTLLSFVRSLAPCVGALLS